MATISRNDINNYVRRQRALRNKANEEMVLYATSNGLNNLPMIKAYAKALVDKYGEASASLAAMFCEETATAEALAEGLTEAVLAADPAKVASFAEVSVEVDKASMMNDATSAVGRAVSKYVKKAALDTAMQYAEKTGRQWAWMPTGGDTCAFCIMLASRGFMNERNRQASHVHANCDCVVVTRKSFRTKFGGYNPQKYLDMYNNADPGGSPKDKLNALRRRLEGQKRQVTVDESDSEKRIRNAAEFTAFKAKGSKYGVYISEYASKKAQNLANIEKALDKAVETLKIEKTRELPKVFVLNQNEMGIKTFAAYNVLRNEIYISDIVGNKGKTISVQKKMGFADSKSWDSTIRHELIHWKDAEEYRKKKTINNTDELVEYLKELCNDCKMKLDKAGITVENIDSVSRYARDSYEREEYDEAYTEYRVSKKEVRE